MKRRHEYSQNFLRSPKLVEELVKQSSIKKDDLVLDIGAGSGVITSVLAARVRKVIAVEYEPKTAETLRRNMIPYENVEVVINDFLTLELPKEPFKIFANIPFHLSSPIIHRFIDAHSSPKAAYLIVQKQFGRKLVATDTTHFTSQLGMIIGAEYHVKVIKNLRKEDFMPRPAVDTVCIELLKRDQPLVLKNRLKAYEKFTNECFSDPKKLAIMPLEIIGKQPGISPSRLSLDQWVLLFNTQKKY
ncbi:MAG: rRNA adenine dimethyltransferase family protein [Candidatus Microsaccharimonas sp.]